MEQNRNAYKVWVGNLKERENLDNLGVDGRINLKWILKKCDKVAWTALMWLRMGTGGGRW
jgi:hypothetical protein